MKNQAQKKGISLIALIITIIVIVLLAAIVVNTAITTPQSANFAKFASDMGELQQAVTLTYFDIYSVEAVKTSPKTDAEIYKEIAGGAEYGTSLPTGIDGNKAWLVANADRLNSVDTLPYADLYITDTGTIFRKSGYENNGEIFLTPSVKVGEVVDAPYNETDGVNAPLLVNNLIPVYYNNGWKMADKNTNTWYDYDAKEWANAVTVKAEKRGTYNINDKIKEEDIIGMFVWIPRYAYQITGTGTIGVKFLKGTTDTCIDDTVALRNGKTELNYVVHPAFTNGASTSYKNGEWKKEITGMWVAKFEASSSEATADCTFDASGKLTTTENTDADRKIGSSYGRTNNIIDNVTVRPNVTSWRNISVNEIFNRCFAMNGYHGISSVLNSHMMKNSEWGAVAYLTQSNYGYNAGENKILNNSYYESDGKYGSLTGMAGGNAINDSTSVALLKNTRAVNVDGSITIAYTDSTSKTFYRYYTENGVKASTTGNIYGIYDMSGGAWEYVASYVDNGHENITKIGHGGDIGGNISRFLKQVYTSTVSDGSDSRADDYALLNKINDVYPVYGDAVKETASWNGDYAIFPNSGTPFFRRGGDFGNTTPAGVFSFIYGYGGPSDNYGFRPVLSAM